jgi:hypothetical protein
VQVRVKNPTAATQRPVLTLAGNSHALGPVKAGVVATFRIAKAVRPVPLGG